MGTLTISGIGIKNAIPDIASIRASVQATKETTQEALTLANEGMASLIAKLDELGLDKKDRQTAHFSVRAEFKKDDSGYQHDQITGWTVQNTLVVKIRNLSQLGVILTLAGEHGSVNGPSFSNSKESALLDEARQLAMKDAIRKAKLYAEAAGVSLGEIIEIVEEQSHQQPYAAKAMRMSVCCEDVGSGPAPVEAGEQTLSMSIHAVFEMSGNVTTEAAEEDDDDSFID